MQSAEFSSSSFNPRLHVSEQCSGQTTLAQLQAHGARVRAAAEQNKRDLRANVYRNYAQYTATSKEVARLEADIYEVQSLLDENRSLIRSMSELAASGQIPGSAVTTEKLADFDDFLREEQDRNPLLQGSVLHQGRLAMDDDGETTMAVYVFIVPQAMVIAEVTRASATSRDTLEMLGVEALEDVTVIDEPEREDARHAFTVEGAETQLYLCRDALQKTKWLRVIRRAVAALPRDGAEGPGLAAEEEAEESDASGDGSWQDGWLADVPQDLDVCMAQRCFGDAVDLLEESAVAMEELPVRGKTSSSALAKQKLESTLADRRERLVGMLCAELERPALREQSIRSTVLLLLRLGSSEKACRCYLAYWGRVIGREFRKLKMEGSTELYINKLARVFFAAIRSTCAEFVHLFENASKSSYMKWVNEQMTVFSDAFGRQVLQSSTTSFAACADCLQVAYAGCRSLLDVGLDLEFVLWQSFCSGTTEVLDSAGQAWLTACAHLLVDAGKSGWKKGQKFKGKRQREKFLAELKAAGAHHPDDYLEGTSTVLFEAISYFCTSSHNFTRAAACTYSPLVAHCILGHIEKVTLVVVDVLCKAYDGREVFHTNAVFLMDSVLPHAAMLMEKAAGVKLARMEKLARAVSEAWAAATSEEGISHI